MFIQTPNNLLYPIKITRLFCKQGDEVKRNQTLFSYEYTSKVHESTVDDPEGKEVERTWPATFESELEGTVKSVIIKAGQVLVRRTAVIDIEEPCKHEVQYGGICAICGTDVTTITNYNSTISTKDRAHINTVHGNTALLISQSEANRADDEAKRRLLDTRKLILVVDLDQTIIHATVDPTVAEWQQDLSNPNHDAVKDVRSFHLADDIPGTRGCWYYIKLRPGLKEFLETISKIYELHIYTMGTRAYAENIAKIIDPDRKMFADRILSRDESGSMTHKQLKRLFPVDSKMVVIIDDRGDVWEWSPNLVKVSVYDFFVGIGDINGSFLPKRPGLEAKTTMPDSASNGAAKIGKEVSAVDQLVSMAGDQDAASLKEKTEEQDTALATQLVERPLLQKQKILDAVEEEPKISPAAEAAAELLSMDTATDSFEHPRYRHNLLQDDDTELIHLTKSLQSIHRGYYEKLDRQMPVKSKLKDFQAIPDAAAIMKGLKEQVLSGTQLVFSGVVPLGTELDRFDTVIWAQTFGARVSANITTRTTHVVASPERRTAKVRQAARKGGRIKIVSVAWLMACFSQWRRVSEEAYLIHTDASRKDELVGGLPDSFGDEDKMVLSSSEDGDMVTEDEVDYTNTTPSNEETDDQAVEEELAKYAPRNQREGSSPLDTDDVEHWDDIDAELADFMGSEDDESDLESIRSNDSINPSGQGKRKRNGDGDMEEGAVSSDNEGSRLQKRKKEASARTSGLANVTTISRSPPTRTASAVQSDDDEDDDLTAALEAEFLADD